MSMAPQVSIIICTRNRARDLALTLKAIDGISLLSDLPCELVVVDNASADDTAQVIHAHSGGRLPVRSVYEERPGKGHAYNTAVASTQGAVLLFTDDDVRPPRYWLPEMCLPILAQKADALAGGVAIAPHLQRPWMQPLHREWLASTEYLNAQNVTTAVGANMAFSREVFAKVPRFDPELGPGALGFSDETLFCWQVKEAGYSLQAALETIVEHHFSPTRLTRASFHSTAVRLGRSNAYLMHHWEHRVIGWGRRRFLSLALEAFKRRLRQQLAPPAQEGMLEAEMLQTAEMHTYRHYLFERKRAPNYARHGLVKIAGLE